MKGYKGMIRDRMPLMLNLALKWCKAKERWIDYVYDNVIRKYPENKRSIVVKQILGIKQRWKRQEIYDQIRYSELEPITMDQINKIPKSELYMKFSDTIDWSTLYNEDRDMYDYWKVIAEWVNWFSTEYTSIKSTYSHALRWGMSTKDDIKPILMSKYQIDGKLADYLIKSFK